VLLEHWRKILFWRGCRRSAISVIWCNTMRLFRLVRRSHCLLAQYQSPRRGFVRCSARRAVPHRTNPFLTSRTVPLRASLAPPAAPSARFDCAEDPWPNCVALGWTNTRCSAGSAGRSIMRRWIH
jgi:hypothetical protein